MRPPGESPLVAGAPAISRDLEAFEDLYSTPWDAPLVPRFPIRYRRVALLTVTYRTDPDAIALLLPPPLEPISDVVLIHFGDFPDVEHLGHVHECHVMIGATLASPDRSLTGGYTTMLLIDSDGGLAAGREVHGQPKKFARPRLEIRGDLIVGTAERNGISVVTATLPYKSRPADPAEMYTHFDFTENINLKLVPHIDGRPAVRQLTARRLADVEVTECWGGRCTVELRPNAQAPVWRLPVIESLAGYFWSADFTLQPGRVILDYLANDVA